MTSGKRYAVVVGVNEYEDAQFSTLHFARNDAVRVAELLVRYGSFSKERVYLLANGEGKGGELGLKPLSPTRADLLQRLQYVAKTATQDDLILLFFAGHGAEVTQNPYLLTCDTRMDVLKHTGVSVTELNELLGGSQAGCVVRVFDACRTGYGEARALLGRMTEGLQAAMLKTGKGWASFSSCSAGEVASESGEYEQGVFSYYLCEGIEGKAANEQNGEVTFDRLVDYVKTSVGNWADEQSQRQTPHVQADMSGSLVVAMVEKQRQKESKRVDVGNPLATLGERIDRHLAETPDDVRRLTLTDEREWKGICELVAGYVGEIHDGFAHPALKLEFKTGDSLGELGVHVADWFGEDLRKRKVKQELKQPPFGVHIVFGSSEVAVPTTRLTVAVCRFSYFYWLWYFHECSSRQMQGTFSAEPGHKTGFITFKARAAADTEKVKRGVREILKRATDDIVTWGEQLRKYVDGRFGPLRESGDIID
jgi:hypothetical protein